MMKRWIATLGCISTILALGGGTLAAAPAQAMEPSHSTWTFDFTTSDFLGSPPTGAPGASQCAFPITASWHISVDETDYFYEATGTIKTAIWRLDILEGILSNPLTGKSVYETFHSEKMQFFYAPDGSLTGFFENESRDNPYLHMAGHYVSDATGAIVKDVGRDTLPVNRHPMNVTPLCDALS